MPGNEPIKITKTFICIRRKPVAFAYCFSIVILTSGTLYTLMQMPAEWRSNIYPKLEGIRGDQLRIEEQSVQRDTILKNDIVELRKEIYGN